MRRVLLGFAVLSVVSTLGCAGTSSDTGIAPQTTRQTTQVTTPPPSSPSDFENPFLTTFGGRAASEFPALPTREASDAPASPGVAGPPELLGTWWTGGGSEGSGALFIYRFDSDGTYAHVLLLVQDRPTGAYYFQIDELGSYVVDGDQIVLRVERGTESRHDPGTSEDDYVTAVPPVSTTVVWSIDPASDELLLVEEDGSDNLYRRRTD